MYQFAPDAPVPAAAPAGAGSLRRLAAPVLRFMGPGDRRVLGMWALAHVALLVFGWAAAWVTRPGKAHAPLAKVYEQWDALILRGIAAHGYFSPRSDPHAAAFFPGYPLALAAVHFAVRDWILAELVLSAAAGGVALLALRRAAGGDERVVLYLLTAPAAVFLTVGYTESLFLALAVPAWLAAKRGSWATAGLLGAGATTVRVNGLFLAAALAVLAVTSPPGRRLAGAAWAAAAAVPAGLYAWWLHAATGDWAAWQHAEAAGWDRHFTAPWRALATTWWAAFGHPFGADYGFMFQLEIIAAAVGVAGCVLLAWRRWWPEAAYCGLSVAALVTSTWFESVPRTLLLAFPLWVMLAAGAARRPWVGRVYLAVSGPLAAVLALVYLSGNWAG